MTAVQALSSTLGTHTERKCVRYLKHDDISRTASHEWNETPLKLQTIFAILSYKNIYKTKKTFNEIENQCIFLNLLTAQHKHYAEKWLILLLE